MSVVITADHNCSCEHYRLGQTMDDEYATYPLRTNGGDVLGVVRRKLFMAPDEKNKYLYPYETDVSKLVFDIHRMSSDTLIVTEGATDAMACYEAGFDMAVAVYGARLSYAQRIQILKYAPKLLLVGFDQDVPGDQGYARIKEALGTDVQVRRMCWSQAYKDLASMPLDYRRELLGEIVATEEKTRLGSQS